MLVDHLSLVSKRGRRVSAGRSSGGSPFAWGHVGSTTGSGSGPELTDATKKLVGLAGGYGGDLHHIVAVFADEQQQ